jgi:hypothetical protein
MKKKKSKKGKKIIFGMSGKDCVGQVRIRRMSESVGAGKGRDE